MKNKNLIYQKTIVANEALSESSKTSSFRKIKVFFSLND